MMRFVGKKVWTDLHRYGCVYHIAAYYSTWRWFSDFHQKAPLIHWERECFRCFTWKLYSNTINFCNLMFCQLWTTCFYRLCRSSVSHIIRGDTIVYHLLTYTVLHNVHTSKLVGWKFEWPSLKAISGFCRVHNRFWHYTFVAEAFTLQVQWSSRWCYFLALIYCNSWLGLRHTPRWIGNRASFLHKQPLQPIILGIQPKVSLIRILLAS